MFIFGSGIKCPRDRMSTFGSGIKCPQDRMSTLGRGSKVYGIKRQEIFMSECRGSNVYFGVGDQMSGIKCPFWGRGSNVRGSNVHFGLGDQKSGDQMSGDQMSIFGLGIKSPGIKCPGIKCPFWCWGSKVRGSNVHFRVRDQTSSGSNVHFMSGI